MLQEIIGAVTGGDPNSMKNVDRFNNVLIEFFTKLKRVGKFCQKSTERMDKILDLANENSSIPLNIFKASSKGDIRKKLMEHDATLLDKLPLLEKDDFNDLSEKTKKSTWKYIKKLLKIADESSLAPMDLNQVGEVAMTALQNVDIEKVGEAAYGLLDSVKNIFKRHQVTEEKFLAVTEDIVEAIPSVGQIQPKNYAGKAKKFVRSLLFTDDFENPLKRIKRSEFSEAKKP